MKPPTPLRCAHCGAEISPAASVCGFCQKPVGLSWLLRPVLAGLLVGLTLGLAAVGALWLRASLRLAAAQKQADSAPTVPQPAPAESDPEYAGMLAEAEREVARGDHRTAIVWLMQALRRRPDRPEARARLELLRTELMKSPGVTLPSQAAATPDEELVSIPGGPFVMGAGEPGGSADEYPAHEVFLPPFRIAAHEVTVASYRKFCAATGRPFPRQPSWSTPRHPVVSVTWREAQDYCGYQARQLPTEAEWERAARCGLTQRYLNGFLPQFLELYAWFAGNSGGLAHPVGTKMPGGCGIFDAYGNVWEWVADWYSGNYYDDSPKRDPRGRRYGEEKVLRGGAFDSPPEALATTFRDRASPGSSAENRGFRCAQSRPQ